jgi:hypothetical protein
MVIAMQIPPVVEFSRPLKLSCRMDLGRRVHARESD